MKTKLLTIVLAVLFISCAAAPPKEPDLSKPSCTKYIELEVSKLECFNTLYILVQQEMLEMVYADVDGKPITVLLNMGEELWNSKGEPDDSAAKTLGLALLAFKGFKDVKVVKIYFSGAAVMEFFLEGDKICVKNMMEGQCEPEEVPDKLDKGI